VRSGAKGGSVNSSREAGIVQAGEASRREARSEHQGIADAVQSEACGAKGTFTNRVAVSSTGPGEGRPASLFSQAQSDDHNC
jgi:hypothetical protein